MIEEIKVGDWILCSKGLCSVLNILTYGGIYLERSITLLRVTDTLNEYTIGESHSEKADKEEIAKLLCSTLDIYCDEMITQYNKKLEVVK